MFNNRPGGRRQVGREVVTLLLAFAIAALVGKSILRALSAPPLILTLLILVALYAVAYFAIWRLTDVVFR